MKKWVFFMVMLVAFSTILAGSLSIAVLDFEPRGINEDQAVIITDILRTELLKTGRITLVEREKINALIKERQLSGVGITESVELGKVLGVDKIIFGRIGMLGDKYVVTVRMIDVSTGKVDFADQYTCQMTTESITKVMEEIANVVQKYLPPLEGKVALRKGNIVYITLSSREGVLPNMELAVYRVDQVKDDEGNVIFEDIEEIGKIKVLKVSNKGSSAEVVSEKEKIEKGDIVKLSVSREKSKEVLNVYIPKQTVQNYSQPFYYWIQDKKKVWIKGNWEGKKVIYVYYGAENGNPKDRWENGDEVFEFWDDFLGSHLSTEKWKSIIYNAEGIAKVEVKEGYIKVFKSGNGWTGIVTLRKFTPSLCFEAKVYHDTTYDGRAPVIAIVNEEHIYDRGHADNKWMVGIRAFYSYSRDNPLRVDIYGFKEDGVHIGKIHEGENGANEWWNNRVCINNSGKINISWNEEKYVNSYNLTAPTSKIKGRIGIFSEVWWGKDYMLTTRVDYIFVTKYTPTPPVIEYSYEESGYWNIERYTFTKRRKVIVRSEKPLDGYQIALDFSKFNDENLIIVEMK